MRTTKEDVLIQKREIINKAMEVFGQKGYANTNMEDIATALGISRSPIYYHYANKFKLFCCVVEEYYTQLEGKIRHVFSQDKSIFLQLEEHLMHGYTNEERNYSKINMDVHDHADDPLLEQMKQRLYQSIAAIKMAAVESAMKRGELKPELDMDAFVGLTFVFHSGLSSNIAYKTPYSTYTEIQKLVSAFIALLKTQYGTEQLSVPRIIDSAI